MLSYKQVNKKKMLRSIEYTNLFALKKKRYISFPLLSLTARWMDEAFTPQRVTFLMNESTVKPFKKKNEALLTFCSVSCVNYAERLISPIFNFLYYFLY